LVNGEKGEKSRVNDIVHIRRDEALFASTVGAGIGVVITPTSVFPP
jgi:hypothetical protein